MAFTGQSTALKFGFIMDVLLVLLGLITLFSILKYSKQEVKGYDYCLLFIDADSGEQPSACTFSSAAGGIIILAAAALTFMDYVTWKRSENYKGKRASFAALLITPIMTLFSFCTAIVVVLGIRKACGGDCNKNVPFVKGIYTAIGCAALSGLFFAIYGISEYVQYRRRHVNGDKW
ncbi:hypothetical protein MVEG_01730 [Podila verticillata NRRL 6337]|nr:hypothetical protein MVEG_01730 [Podila verticillata NRRL 6337]